MAGLFSSPDPVPISDSATHEIKHHDPLIIDLPTNPSQFEEKFAISDTAQRILSGGFKRVALQLPDSLLKYSVPLYQGLNKHLSASSPATKVDLYVLADTSYSNCCVDEVSASHVDADAIIHFGHACLSQTSRLPVIYVFPRSPLHNLESCVDALWDGYVQNQESSTREAHEYIELKHDVSYSWVGESIAERISNRTPSSHIKLLHDPIPCMTHPRVSSVLRNDKNNTLLDQNTEVKTIFYIGDEETPALNFLLLSRPLCTIHIYTPPSTTGTGNGKFQTISPINSSSNKRFLTKRYGTIQKARDSDVFGLVVGTLGVASYLHLLTTIRQLIKSHHKKSYTISVGKPTPAKLANFLEIECWVVVDCREGSLGWAWDDKVKEFYKPIITPYELVHALMPIEKMVWGGHMGYVLEFDQVLELMKEDIKVQEDREVQVDLGEDGDGPQFSMSTGQYRDVRRFGGEKWNEKGKGKQKMANDVVTEEASLVKQADQIELAGKELEKRFENFSPAAQYLHSRTYQGLTRQNEGHHTGPTLLEQGRNGIAKGYQQK